MPETIKEKILNKAIDDVLEVVVDTSKQEIEELVEKNRLQKILSRTIEKIGKSDWFKREYRDVAFEFNRDSVYYLTNEELDVSNTVQNITNSVLKIVRYSFVSDDDSVYQGVAEKIARVYIQRAKVTVCLYDVIKLQHDTVFKIDEGISDLKHIILSNYNSEIKLRQERELLLKRELKNESLILLTEIMRNYVYLLLKESPMFEGEVRDVSAALISEMESLVQKIDELIAQDFYMKPVVVDFVNELKVSKKEVICLEFMEICVHDVILRNTEKMLKYKDIMDIELEICILRLRNAIQSDWFPVVIANGQSNILKNSNITIDLDYVNGFRSTLKNIGKLIISLYGKLIY